MDRSIGSNGGFTLLELIVALTLGSVILLTSSNFLVNYVKYSSNVIKSESSLMMTTMQAFEEIVDKINSANKAVCGSETYMDVPSTPRPTNPTTCAANTTCIQLRCDTISSTPGSVNTPSTFSDDTVYTYWLSGTNLYKAVNSGAGTIIATGINTLAFTRVDRDNSPSASYFNTIRVTLGVQASSGVTGGVLKEYLDTTVVMRGKSLN